MIRVQHIPMKERVEERDDRVEDRALWSIKEGLIEEGRKRAEGGEDLGTWYILTNVRVAGEKHLLEVDMVVIGPPGVRVIEVKKSNPEHHIERKENDGDKLKRKKKAISDLLGQEVPGVEVTAVFLIKKKSPPKVYNFDAFRLGDWRTAVGFGNESKLTETETEKLCRKLDPGDVSLRTLGMPGGRSVEGYTEFELISPREPHHPVFYRKFSVVSERGKKGTFNLYDTSAVKIGKKEKAVTQANRPGRVYQRKRGRSWMPKMVTTQLVRGSRCMHFSVTFDRDPSIKNIKERSGDTSWTAKERAEFARDTIRVVAEMHADDMLHRRLSPYTILVKECEDGSKTPMLTDFGYVKLPEASEGTVTALPGPDPDPYSQLGTIQSDVDSLRDSLKVLFEKEEGVFARRALDALKPRTLPDLEKSFTSLIDG